MWLLLKVEFEGWRHEITGEVHKSTRKAQLKHDAWYAYYCAITVTS